MTPPVNLPREALEAFCRQWRIARLELFGSVLRDDFRPDSDIDFLATFMPDSPWSLLDLVQMEQELDRVLGRRAHLIERSAVEKSHNPIRREEILQAAMLYFDAEKKHAA